MGIRQNFKILAADIADALAFATIRGGQRYIVYDRNSYGWPDGQASWKGVSTFGHEVGHHTASHVFVDEYSQHQKELEADRFSGFVMYKLGASLDQATGKFWDWPASQTHPGGARRKKAAEAGWRHAEKMKARESGSCRTGWVGQEKDVDGVTCRIVQSCEGGQQSPRLACQDYEDRWRWMR